MSGIYLDTLEFKRSFELVPRVAVTVIIKNIAGEILLTKRSIDPFKGHWHLPGSFILKNESIDQCVRRVVKEECGISIESLLSYQQTHILENLDGDPRGHIIDIIFTAHIKDNISLQPNRDTAELQFFSPPFPPLAFKHEKIL